MRATQEMGRRPRRWLIVLGIMVMFTVLAGTVVVASAQSEPGGEPLQPDVDLAAATPPPDTWAPPEVFKLVDASRLGRGDRVRFMITVRVPEPPDDQVSWYEVQLTDVFSPALRVDSAVVIPSTYDVVVVGNRVVAKATVLQPGGWYVVVVDCTLVDDSQPGPSIVNVARVDYEDEAGNPDPFGPKFSAPVTITVVLGGKVYLPLLVRNYPPPLPAPVLSPISNPDADGTYIVSWSAVAGATAYTLQEATDSSFAGAVQVYQGSNTSFGIGGRGPTRYYYRVKASDVSRASSWSNVRAVDVRWEMEPNNTAAQANGRIVSGLTYLGVFPSVADLNDWFYLDLAVPFPVVELWLTNIPAGSDYDLYLYDANLELVAKSNEYGNVNEHIQVVALPSGRYYVRVYNFGATGSTQSYNLRAVYED